MYPLSSKQTTEMMVKILHHKGFQSLNQAPFYSFCDSLLMTSFFQKAIQSSFFQNDNLHSTFILYIFKTIMLPFREPPSLGNWESTGQKIWEPSFRTSTLGGRAHLKISAISSRLCILYICELEWNVICIHLECWPPSFQWSLHSAAENGPLPPPPLQHPRSNKTSTALRMPQCFLRWAGSCWHLLPRARPRHLKPVSSAFPPAPNWIDDVTVDPDTVMAMLVIEKIFHFNRWCNSLRPIPLCAEMPW